MKVWFLTEAPSCAHDNPSSSRTKLHWNVGLSALLAAAMAVAVTPAMADSYNFSFNGGGLSGSGILQFSNSPVPDVPGAFQITGITGTFTDTSVGLTNQQITGLETTSLPSVNSDGTFLPPGAPAPFSFDNLFYPDGNSPLICPPLGSGYPFSGGVLDIYGLLFDVQGGYTVDLWSNGITPGSAPNVDYEVDDSYDGGSAIHPVNADGDAVSIDLTTSPTPEPSSLFLLGTGLLGLVGVARRRFV